MIKLLYLHNTNGDLYVTTCDPGHLIKEMYGYSSKCGARWVSLRRIESLKNESSYNIEDLLLQQLNLSNIPEPQTHEIIELYLDIKLTNYNYIDYEDSSNK